MAEANPLEDAALTIASKMTGHEKGYAFDPLLIVTLLSFIVPLFKDCGMSRSPEQFAKVAKRPGIFQRAALLSRCRDAVGNREARSLYNATLKAAEEASEQQIADCCRAAQDMGEAA